MNIKIPNTFKYQDYKRLHHRLMFNKDKEVWETGRRELEESKYDEQPMKSLFILPGGTVFLLHAPFTTLAPANYPLLKALD